MIIRIYDKVAFTDIDVDVLSTFKCQPYQKVDYIELMSKKTKPYNYGTDYDKLYSEFTITGTKAEMINIADLLDSNKGQIQITTSDGEYIFGAGIDYDNPFLCNITDNTRPYTQDNFATAEIKLKVECMGYVSGSDVNQVFYRASIPAGLPTCLNYQTPIRRSIGKNENDFTLQKFGEFGMITEVNSSLDPVNNYILDIVFAQTFDEAAQIEKYYNTQRSTPFLLSNISNIDLFPNQDTDNVIIGGLKTNRVGLNDWRLSLRLITNV